MKRPELKDSLEFLSLTLFGLEEHDVEKIYCENAYDKGKPIVFVHVFLTPVYPECPRCGYDEPDIHCYYSKIITHSVLTDRACKIYYHVRRYICPVCGKTYSEHNPFTFNNMKISAKTVYSILDDLKDINQTFTSVARKYHISPTTAISIFDRHVNMPRATLPECILIDECYAFSSADSDYVCMLLDYRKRTAVDILPSRRFKEVCSYLFAIPLEERQNVKYTCSDLYEPYRKVVKACFPNAIHACDHFHVSAQMNKRVDEVRIRVMKKKKKEDPDAYYLLKKFSWMIYKSEPSDKERRKLQKEGKLELFDPNRERKYNARLGRYLNYCDIRDMIWQIDPELTRAWKLKDEFVDFYHKADINSAPRLLDELIDCLLQKDETIVVNEIVDFARTMRKWKKEIINSFTVIGFNYEVDKDTGQVAVHEHHLSSSLIENRNKVLKTLKNGSCGYSNWKRFRNRAMYVLDPNSTYALYPIYGEDNKKK